MNSGIQFLRLISSHCPFYCNWNISSELVHFVKFYIFVQIFPYHFIKSRIFARDPKSSKWSMEICFASQEITPKSKKCWESSSRIQGNLARSSIVQIICISTQEICNRSRKYQGTSIILRKDKNVYNVFHQLHTRC